MVYHGTTLSNANKIVTTGVDPTLGRAAADFGQGFYVTTVLDQAREWANQKTRIALSPGERASVLVFNLNRDTLGVLGDHLAFLVPNSKFYEFVLYNRLEKPSHGRSKSLPYDIVYGPVSLYPQNLDSGEL